MINTTLVITNTEQEAEALCAQAKLTATSLHTRDTIENPVSKIMFRSKDKFECAIRGVFIHSLLNLSSLELIHSPSIGIISFVHYAVVPPPVKKTACDCGADKAGTTHSGWCSKS